MEDAVGICVCFDLTYKRHLLCLGPERLPLLRRAQLSEWLNLCDHLPSRKVWGHHHPRLCCLHYRLVGNGDGLCFKSPSTWAANARCIPCIAPCQNCINTVYCLSCKSGGAPSKGACPVSRRSLLAWATKP
ncbi:hypothetical protein Rsub_05577 [Raphidocelis subcapitata]|uniref:Uncharacterized protein n=1 Tax=Raphidocelis subcapitata TaxID=307507 RepID=A0A2V0P5L9_9CHLO|nr:hypothetical protein Rsub_05577 [Raphidocelis subcapitata]|eukprot:GBF92375.1 hypothetical protein Rsub_05577 [Raphidocelis subcapitata]